MCQVQSRISNRTKSRRQWQSKRVTQPRQGNQATFPFPDTGCQLFSFNRWCCTKDHKLKGSIRTEDSPQGRIRYQVLSFWKWFSMASWTAWRQDADQRESSLTLPPGLVIYTRSVVLCPMPGAHAGVWRPGISALPEFVYKAFTGAA